MRYQKPIFQIAALLLCGAMLLGLAGCGSSAAGDLETEIADALAMLEAGEIREFREQYDSIQETYSSLPEKQKSKVSNYAELAEAWQTWEEEIRAGILGSFVDVLQTDFSPSWELTEEEFKEKYGLEPFYETEERTCYAKKINILETPYLCFVDFKDGAISRLTIMAESDAESEKEETSIRILRDYFEVNGDYLYAEDIVTDDFRPIQFSLSNDKISLGRGFALKDGRMLIIVQDESKELLPINSYLEFVPEERNLQNSRLGMEFAIRAQSLRSTKLLYSLTESENSK